MLDIADTAHILKNIQEYLRIKCPVAWVPGTRTSTTPNKIETAKYQLQITIPDQHTFDMIRNRLFLLIEREVKHQISPNEWQIHIPPEVSQWHHFGQKSGKYAIFYPAEFTQPGDYRICHAICERLLVQPAVMCRMVIQTVINAMGASNPAHNLHHNPTVTQPKLLNSISRTVKNTTGTRSGQSTISSRMISKKRLITKNK